MPYRRVILLCCLLGLSQGEVAGQFNTFGYFQTSFQHRTSFPDEPAQNFFSLQQLNLFFQTNISRRWGAFVNFEVLNNFSSSRRWGSFNLEEAWLRYRHDARFNLKAGLQIPVFNHLNEIKNRSPLLPYIVRPLVYETSFNEFIAVEAFTPTQAFLQAYGFLSVGETKLDYAAYLGNSPNIRSQFDNLRDGGDGQTGVDTTKTLLVGGRLGLRQGNAKAGASATYDVTNAFQGAEALFGGPATRFEGVPRIRVGGDFSVHVGRFSFEGELILVSHDEDEPELNVDNEFFYGTLGAQANERLFVYASYWNTVQREVAFDIRTSDGIIPVFPIIVDIESIQVGVAFSPNERITLKAQGGPVEVVQRATVIPFGDITSRQWDFSIYGVAASVLF